MKKKYFKTIPFLNQTGRLLLLFCLMLSFNQKTSAQTGNCNIVTNSSFNTNLSGWTASNFIWSNYSASLGQYATMYLDQSITGTLSQNISVNVSNPILKFKVAINSNSGNGAGPAYEGVLRVSYAGVVYAYLATKSVDVNTGRIIPQNGATGSNVNVVRNTYVWTTVTYSLPAGVPATGILTYQFTAGSCGNCSDDILIDDTEVSIAVTPTLSAATQPTCASPTGSFTITNYNANSTYAITPSTGVSRNGNTITAPAGTYTITGTSGTCTTASSASVTVNTQPVTPVVPAITATGASCAASNGSINVTNPVAGITYTLSPGGVISTTGSFTGLGAGSYTVTASNGTCSSGASDSQNVAAGACCTAGTAQVTLSGTSVTNNCPATTADLTTLVSGTVPSGSTLVFFTTANHATGTQVPIATAATVPGTYYVFYFDSANNCYNTNNSTSIITALTTVCCAPDAGSIIINP